MTKKIFRNPILALVVLASSLSIAAAPPARACPLMKQWGTSKQTLPQWAGLGAMSAIAGAVLLNELSKRSKS